jgi:hypothetical protein
MHLHELLAVEGNQQTQANKVRKELESTFDKKRHLFERKIVTFTSSTEGSEPVVEEQSDINTTVSKEIQWIKGHLTKALDLEYQIAETNTIARADVELDDGSVLLKAVPATSLLELQKRMAELLELAKAIPTLDPAKGFQADPAAGEGVFQARIVNRDRTKKVPKAFVAYEATKEHPAQVQMFNEDIKTGTITTQEWSGMMTPADKAAVLDRIESLTRAIRAARSRANTAEVDRKNKIGDAIFTYIFG